MRIVSIVLALLILGFGLSYVGTGMTRPALDTLTRGTLQSEGKAHSFVEIDAGTVHFRDEGPRDAPTIMLVHGFSTPSFVYEDYFVPLTAAGFRVISFDTFGRGYSDRPTGPYDKALFVGQVEGLRRALNVEGPVHLVGYSMGGGIVADYAAAHPEHVGSATFLAPVGFSELAGTPGYLTAPIVGDWLFRVLGPKFILSRLEDGLEEAPNPQRFFEQFRERAAYAGYYDALLSTIRNYPFDPRQEEHKQIVANDIRVLSVWGDKDATVPIEGADVLRRWNGKAGIKVIEGGSHSITYSHAAEITEYLLENL